MKKNSEEAVADLKTTAIHKKFYDHFSKYKTFEEALSAMKDYQGEFPIGDFLHLIKAMRRRNLENTVSVTSKSSLIRKENERNILRQSKAYKVIIETHSSLNVMRDDISLLLFNTENLYNISLNRHLPFFTLSLF